MAWTNKKKGNGHTEPLFTNRDGKSVCHNCLTNDEVSNYKGLHELNEQRKNESNQTAENKQIATDWIVPSDWDKGTFLQRLSHLMNQFKYTQTDAEPLAKLTRKQLIKSIK
jgi:hypothetical protein